MLTLLCFHRDRYRSTDSDDSEADAASSHYSSAGSDDSAGQPSGGGGGNARQLGLKLKTRLDSQATLDAQAGIKAGGGGQRSPLRAFLRRHVQRGGK